MTKPKELIQNQDSSLIFYSILFIILSSLILPALASADKPPVLITVQGNQMHESAAPLQGFLHGFDVVSYDEDKVDMDMLTALKPKYWRIGWSHNEINNYLLAKQLNPDIKLTFVLSDQLAAMKGGYQNLRPWKNWVSYQNDIKYIISAFKAYNLRIDYWEVWNEPDTNATWTGTCDQAMEMFERTYETIRAIDATAKIVGPSVSDLFSPGACQESFFVTFIKYITENNLKFDAISWHEFDHPKDLLAALQIRTYFNQHPSLGIPQLHINEYSGPLDAPVPGWAVGWLAYLEAVNVSWASRSCWENGCQTGLDGLFQEDNLTPTPLYWVHRAYADLPAQRLIVDTDTPDSVVAMAGKNDGKQELSLLVGRFSGKQQPSSPVDVNITIDAFPYPGESVAGMIQLIPKDSQSGGLPDGPIPVFSSSLPVNNQSVSVSLPAMQDGDAYTITLKPVQ